MLADKTTLEGVYKNFRAIFDDQFTAQPSFDFGPYVMDVPTNTITTSYNWLSAVPAMRRWIGNRLVKDVKAHNYDVTNVPYEATLAVQRRDLETDNMGIYKPQVQLLADEARQHPARLFAAMLDAADSTLCFDGQYLVDTDHPLDDGTTYSNKGTSALSASTLATGIVAMRKFADHESRRLGISPNVLMVPVDLQDTAIQLVYSPGLPGSANNDVNPLARYGLEVVVNPYLTDTNNWFLIDTRKAVKPAIWQHRKAAEFVAADNPTDTTVFMRNEFYYGVDADYTVAAGLPQVIYGAIVT